MISLFKKTSQFSMLVMLMILAGCSGKPHYKKYDTHAFDDEIEDAADEYKVDRKLVKAIIQVESGFNPKAVSPSNAIGLMQLKASTSGCDAYRYKGKRGCPDDDDLLDPETNIDLGTAYISALQRQQLNWINDPLTRRYATEVAYANGAGALLRTFSSNRQTAIQMINQLTPEAFNWHVRQYHPAPQAPRYMAKVEKAYAGL
ncbi:MULTISPECIES: transglycosylase SLT domain-containing protein [Rahnella]|jgi:membrane-bound lytic murein transglycosylase E|uniref:peptidoglycan lytic exotransglycosylase n=1 Tax=Rahnella sp. (strain Y9602) TaxID=2703885 RepID=A0A0H3F993_RAHSY|nr:MULTISPECIES: transglycosylase SLT domain-containing protein [Rahnella]AFE58454.1 lytic transglycosylase [Rahnella aquatilis HX2]AYA07106.1 lytic transglycosylase [Rahnella aquatilis]ADW73806.1 Lytic transglycosylase catalytic [Rahnella aceris]AZP42298.1 transglycosylase SLT domain-containing protein [Rahnella aquatilis]AZP46638.1 transglycosylase SLT domain-containing protein [Rahnella aquatilis]